MKNPIKLSNEINIFVTLLLFVVILFQTIIGMYCLRLVDDKKEVWKRGVIRDFEFYVSKNIDELSSIRRSIIREDELWRGLEAKSPEYQELREKVYSLQEFSDGIIHAAAFSGDGDMTSITGNISDAESEEIKKSFQLYMKEYVNGIEYYDFFEFVDSEAHDIYFISISPVKRHNYKLAKDEVMGHLCTFIQTETAELFADYDEVSGIKINLTSSSGKNVVAFDSSQVSTRWLTESWSGERLPGTNWRIDGSITLAASRIDWTSFLLLFILESLLLVAIILAFSYLLKRRTISPLKQIGKFMRFFRISDSFKPIEVDGNAELIELAAEINKMVKRNKVLANDIMAKQGKLYEVENLKNEATLYALQNQVNPHYLYNIFELIRSIALVRGVSEIETISVCVSEIFRYNLKKENVALLADEVDITKRYVSIMQVKYGESFDVIYELEKDTLDKMVMKMIFQPVIENAFGHGYVRRADKFFVKIRSWMEGDTLCLSFYDNGLGMTHERLAEINEKIKADKMASGKGIGIANLAHRLKMMYGDKCTFRIESEKDKFTEIIITISL